MSIYIGNLHIARQYAFACLSNSHHLANTFHLSPHHEKHSEFTTVKYVYDFRIYKNMCVLKQKQTQTRILLSHQQSIGQK